MKTGYRLLCIVVLLVLVFGVLPVTAAQEGPTEGFPPVTVDSPVSHLLEFVAGALTGTAVTLGAAFGLVGRLKHDQAALDAIEWLGRSIPADTLNQLNELAKNLRDAGDVIDRVTDGKPNTVEMVRASPPELSGIPN